jgi:hypothetical protein
MGFHQKLPAYLRGFRQDQNALKILRTVTIPGSAAPFPIYWQCQLLKKIKYKDLFKIKNKPDPALLGNHLSN